MFVSLPFELHVMRTPFLAKSSQGDLFNLSFVVLQFLLVVVADVEVVGVVVVIWLS
jgi:hypothetical protein